MRPMRTLRPLPQGGRLQVDGLHSIPLAQMRERPSVQDILFHQYDSSPFSEKVCVCLGIKKLAWTAVDQPVIMPKPELVALTGGYRRIPVMQIGADIYCDSQLIVRELERRFPEPTLFPQGDHGLQSQGVVRIAQRPLRAFWLSLIYPFQA